MGFERKMFEVLYTGKRLLMLHLELENRPGALEEVLRVFAKRNVNIISVTAYGEPWWPTGDASLIADISGLDNDALETLIEEVRSAQPVRRLRALELVAREIS